jgi:hypothetical protein
MDTSLIKKMKPLVYCDVAMSLPKTEPLVNADDTWSGSRFFTKSEVSLVRRVDVGQSMGHTINSFVSKRVTLPLPRESMKLSDSDVMDRIKGRSHFTRMA